MKTLYLVAGARPNFMKVAPLVRALRANGADLGFKIIHTGQHYDHELNEVFFDELGIPAPDVLLGAGSGSHAQQTAKIMVSFEETCQKRRPDCVLVVGDVNSTLACSIVANPGSSPAFKDASEIERLYEHLEMLFEDLAAWCHGTTLKEFYARFSNGERLK